MDSLLPYNATDAERALEAAGTAAINLPMPEGLRDPWRVPAALLPWLAWSRSVDEWDPFWSEDAKRETIAASVEVHRRKGTVWAMRRALQAAGLGDAEIQEGWSASQYDAVFAFDGSRNHAPSDHWAEYRVKLSRPMSIRQAELARAILTSAAPARCHLKLMTFEEASNLYNKAINYDGQFTHGVV
ncbi:phage tail protein I [Paracoccus aerius]|uniref:Phage tail protein I n=1 Tax=Paracoccus aerius TaxID=1915382 RepID=A0ABS1SA43_9RHOB|nr:phage tail protein I [Paracoccus aerius]MBL3675601.1 phage tail protein I [Paracoccus aerius]GHG35580.1 tail fiber protein [Paracoccus aerius]